MNWDTLTTLLSRNTTPKFDVNVLEIQNASQDVEFFPIKKSSIPTQSASALIHVPVPVPVPVPVSAHVPVPAPVPVLIHPDPIKEPVTAKYVVDPIIIGMKYADPLYVGAPDHTQRAIECEEAQRLEAKIDSLYKSESGRSRGWTKVGIESMIKPRCASGGDLRELDRAKKPFIWSVVAEDKLMSAFLDFVCIAKGIRVAVWFSETQRIIVYPATDATTVVSPRDESDTVVATRALGEIYHVTSTGHPRYGMSTPGSLLEFCSLKNWKLLPPHSVIHTLSGLTLAELESVATQLGLTDELPRGKTERVEAIAAYKLRKRLEVVF